MAMTYVEPLDGDTIPLDSTIFVHITNIITSPLGPVIVTLRDSADFSQMVVTLVGTSSDRQGTSMDTLENYGFVSGAATLTAQKMLAPDLVVVLEEIVIDVTLVTDVSVSLTGDKSETSPGEEVQLSWSSSASATTLVSSNFGATGVNGSKTVYPTETTEYTITVSDGGVNEATDTFTVTVTPVTPPDLGASISSYSGYSQVDGNGPGGDYERIRPGRATLGGKDCVVLLRRTMF